MQYWTRDKNNNGAKSVHQRRETLAKRSLSRMPGHTSRVYKYMRNSFSLPVYFPRVL